MGNPSAKSSGVKSMRRHFEYHNDPFHGMGDVQVPRIFRGWRGLLYGGLKYSASFHAQFIKEKDVSSGARTRQSSVLNDVKCEGVSFYRPLGRRKNTSLRRLSQHPLAW